jgi:hypothetical protein
MKPAVKVGLIGATVFILIKLSCYFLEISLDNIIPFGLINMFLLLACISIAIFIEKIRGNQLNFLDDVKTGMSAGIPYGIIVSVFLLIYYKNIYPEFSENKLESLKIEMQKSEYFDNYREKNEDLRNKSDEEIREQEIEKTKLFTDANSVFLMNLLATTLLATLNSIIVTIIMRRVIFRNQQ